MEQLGRHIVEVESADIERVIARLEPKLGPCLREGEVAMFRWAEEDVAPLGRSPIGARMRTLADGKCGAPISTMSFSGLPEGRL